MIVTLTGPSCSGKSTLEKALIKQGFASLISTTTRPQRVGEVNGESYYFISGSEFATKALNSEFVESVEFNSNRYAVSKAEMQRVLALGKPVVLVVEPGGLVQIREYAEEKRIEIFSIFLDIPTEVLAERFLKRFRNEVEHSNYVDNVTASSASRLGAMMGEERDWKNAMSGRNEYIYDAILTQFDEESKDEVTQEISAYAYKRQRAAA